ncbi:MAG TPA: cardiolipin synthase [Nitrosospira sp.]
MIILKCAISLCVLLMIGCSALPSGYQTTYGHPAGDLASVRIDGARGPLSVQQTREILAKLKKSGPETSIFARHLALEEGIVGNPLTAGNKVTLLIDGPSTYQSMFAAIEGAKDTINMETYSIEDDEVGCRFADALTNKQKSGVQVNLIYDSIGSHDTPSDFFKPLVDSGAHVLEFNPVNPFMLRKGWEADRDHRKLLVVDGRIAFAGGINISSVYSSGSFSSSKPGRKDAQPWRDTHIRVEGPAVSEFQEFFLATWKKQKGEPLDRDRFFPPISNQGDEVVRAISSTPGNDYSPIYVTLISAINSAETYAYITNAYFVPDPQLLAALEGAARRNVDVRLLLPSKTDSKLVYYASRSYYDELLSAGVKIYERLDALLHAKTAVVDGVWSTVGSTNLDWLSMKLNQEINAVILGRDFGSQMKTMFEKDMEASRLVTLDEWRKRPIGPRIKEFAARLFSRWI